MSRVLASGRLSFVSPMLPQLVPSAPTGTGWLHEIKHDGYRTQLVVDRGQVRAFTRAGHDWSREYAPIINAAGQLA
jgi:bifunctional non-homologous end joining protein LigD